MRTVILTGATGGLGKCLARSIHKMPDMELICVYRNPDKYIQWISAENIKCKGFEIKEDENYRDMERLLADPSEEFVLILNAFSIMPLKKIGTYDDAEIDAMIEGNIRQTVQILNTVINYCQRQDIPLRIINLDSGAADFPLKGWGNYCASKAYVNSFLSVVALENPGFKVVSVDPGVMDTKMQEDIRSTPSSIFDKVADFIEYKSNGVLREPEDVAKYIVDRYITDWKASQLREKMEK